MKRVVIIEDQRAICDMLAELVHITGGFEVIGTYLDGESGVEAILELKPDVVILDLVLPGMSGVEVLHRIAEACPTVKTLVFSGQGSPRNVKEVLAAGADGYVVKTDGFDEFRTGLETIMAGGTYLGPKANTAMRQYLSGGPDQGQKALSSREVQVLQQVVDGKTSREIALNLNLSVRTVDSHRANIMQKLSIRDVPGLTKYAIQSGLV
jgi:two-component system NarL family response regulator